MDPVSGTPTWTPPPGSSGEYRSFKYLLLHEVGHLFGNGHIDYTIMDSGIGPDLADWTNPKSPIYYEPPVRKLQIDQEIELVPNLHLAEEFKLGTAFGCSSLTPSAPGGTCPDFHALAKTFARIFGHAPAGEV